MLCLTLVGTICRAQDCYDIDFENGTLNGWTTSGNVLLVSAGTDVYGGFPVSSPGGNYSVKLGNNTNSAPSTISKSFLVTNNSPILTYKYAMDLLNYPHAAADAGRVIIDIFDNNNNAIQCAHYEALFSSNGGPQGFSISGQPAESNAGFECCYQISYKPWTSLSVDLTPYIGQMVTLKAKCLWCVYDVDWAYAYFDFGCTDYIIKQDTTCNTVGALLVAPSDFETYSWVGPGVVTGQTNDSAYVNQTGTYTVTMTTATGCTISKSINVTNVPPVITASITAGAGICLGGSVTLTASGGLTYLWYNTSVTTSALTVSPTTTSTYIVEVKDIYGCTDTASATITLYPSPVADFSPDDVCLQQAINFTDLSTVQNGNITAWSWSFGDGTPMVFTQNPSHVYANVGTYSVTLIVTSNKGCKDTVVKSVVVHTLPVAQFVSQNVCKGSITPFTDQSSLTGGDVLQLWSWNFGDTSPVINNQNPLHIYANYGAYTVQLITATNFGCADTVIHQLNVNPNPIVNFSAPDTMGCTPFCVNFQNTAVIATGTNISSVWNFGDGSTLESGSAVGHCYSNGSVTTPRVLDISLTVTSDSGCVTTFTNDAYIIVNPKPVADFTAQPEVVSIVDPIIAVSDLSLGADSWNWNYGDLNTTIIAAPLPHTYADTGNYTIRLIVSNQYTCQDTTYRTIRIEPDWAFFIPNVFTPNNDEINDTFQGFGFGLLEYEMFIYDRWGNKIYVTKSYDHPWDGKANDGKEMAQRDVYVYLIQIKDIKGIKHSYSGIVTLVR